MSSATALGEPVGLSDAPFDRAARRTGPARTIGTLMQRRDAKRHAMGKQRGALLVVETDDIVPQRVVAVWQFGLPVLLPFGDSTRRCAVLQIGRLDRQIDMSNRCLQTCAVASVVEAVETELVQKRRHRDAGMAGDGILQRKRAMGREFADKPIGQRLHAVFFFGVLFLAGADGDDGVMGCGFPRALRLVCFGLVLAGLRPALHPRVGQIRVRRAGRRRWSG